MAQTTFFESKDHELRNNTGRAIRAKMSGDVLAMNYTCSGVDRCRYRTCGSTKKHTRDVLTNLRGIFGNVSVKFRRIFGDA